MKFKHLTLLFVIIGFVSCEKNDSLIMDKSSLDKELISEPTNLNATLYTIRMSTGSIVDLDATSGLVNKQTYDLSPSNIRAVDFYGKTGEYNFYHIDGNYYYTKDFYDYGVRGITYSTVGGAADLVGVSTLNDITGMAPSKTYFFYNTGQYSIGTPALPTRYQGLTHFNLPNGKTPYDIKDVAWHLSGNYPNLFRIYIWFKDGTYSYAELGNINFSVLQNYSSPKTYALFGTAIFGNTVKAFYY